MEAGGHGSGVCCAGMNQVGRLQQYSGEDLMQIIKRICAWCTRGNNAAGASKKMVDRYLHGLVFQLKQ